MDKDLEIAKLNIFLEKYGVVDEFWEEVEIFKNRNNNYDLWIPIESCPYDIICSSFTWSAAKRGGLFWESLHDKYERIYDSINVVKNTELARFMYPDATPYKNYLIIINS